ncbi:MAG: HRDC domain-containing protein [Verrucomicrobiae bacterium]|nr:HRDC domain-containing protein [Verrucomicrobiae bacterium]
MISSDSPFREFLTELASQPQIALDTEADSLHCYFEKLCLVQIGWPGKLQLLDPLAKLPLTDFFEALRGKRLIFHDADYDLRLLRRSGEFPDDHIFDTMLAAKLCGESQLGLAALIKKYFDVELSKASRKANWGQRPLSDQMVEYALNDVRYLVDLADIFEERLEELGRNEWFLQSRDRMIKATREVKQRDEETLWRIAGYIKLPPRAWVVLRAMWQWRDAEARRWDKPPFYIMSHEEMLEIADLVSQGKKWKAPKFSQDRATRFQEVLEKALTIPEEEWPQEIIPVRVSITKKEADAFRKFKELRDRKAYELGLDPSIIASKASLEAIAKNVNAPALLPWQREVLGI